VQYEERLLIISKHFFIDFSYVARVF